MKQTTDQSCLKEYIRYTVLSIMGTLGVSCYILADTFFVSAGMGTNGLTALNLAIPVYNFIHGCGLLCGMGSATKYSIWKGQGDREMTDKLFTNTLYLGACTAMLFFLTGIICPEKISMLLGAKGEVLEMTTVYLRWLLLFAPAFIFNDIFLCYVRNDEGPQLSMFAMLIGSFSNIILDYIFIFPLHMGIFGAIFATGLSPLISLGIMSLHKFQKKNGFHFVRISVQPQIAKQIISLGFPSLLGQLSTGIVMITFNFLILHLKGNTGVAAYGIIANLALVIVAVYTGISQGIQPLISDAYGKKQTDNIRRILRYAMTSSHVLSCLMYLGIFIFAEPIASVFNSEKDLALQTMAVDGLKLYFISNLFTGFNIILSVFFTSVDRSWPAQVLSLLRGVLLIVPITFLMAFLFEMIGVWLAYPVTEIVVAALGALIYLYQYQKLYSSSL